MGLFFSLQRTYKCLRDYTKSTYFCKSQQMRQILHRRHTYILCITFGNEKFEHIYCTTQLNTHIENAICLMAQIQTTQIAFPRNLLENYKYPYVYVNQNYLYKCLRLRASFFFDEKLIQHMLGLRSQRLEHWLGTTATEGPLLSQVFNVSNA